MWSFKPFSIQPSLLLMLAVITPAATFIDNSPIVAQTTRTQQAVKINNASDVVNRLTKHNQLYIQGNPISPEQTDRLLKILQKNPNVFVILVANSKNVKQDQDTIDKGVYRSSVFQGIIHPVTKEKQGVLFSVYFDSDQGRQIYLLTAELPNRLGVGSRNSNWLQTFRNAISSGKDVPGALEVVINNINNRIAEYSRKLSGTVNPVASTVNLVASNDVLTITSTTPIDLAQREDPNATVIKSPPKEQRSFPMYLGIAGGGIFLIVHIFSIVSANNKRKKVISLIPSQEVLLRRKTEELLELMNTADYTSIAAYTGETGDLVQQAVKDLNHCLMLLGGAKKILAQVKDIVDRKDIFSFIYPFSMGRAVKLLTDENTKLPIRREDSSELFVSSTSWQEQFSQSVQQEITLSYPEMTKEIEARQQKSYQVLTDVIKKDAEVESFLGKIVQDVQQITPTVQAWQQTTGALFIARQLWQTLIPGIVGEGGLIAQARLLMAKDPVGVWNNYGKKAEQLVEEAKAMIAICQQARSELLPQSEQATVTLQSHSIATDWIGRTNKELSDRLESLAANALHSPCLEGIRQIRQDITNFQNQMQTALQQDQQRRTIIPERINCAITAITQTKQQLLSIYQQQGVSVSQVLAEPGRNPAEQVSNAQKELEQIKFSLDRGDVTEAQKQIDNIDSLLKESDSFCKESLEFLPNYKLEATKLQNYRKSVADKVGLNYKPIADRLVNTYHPDALSKVAAELDCLPTVANIIDRVQASIAEVDQLIEQSHKSYTTAQILKSRDQQYEATKYVKEAERMLAVLPKAEQILQQRQRQAREEIEKIQREMHYTLDRKREFYARDNARRLCNQIEIQLRDMNNLITLTPQNPYRIEDLIFQIKQLKQEAIRELDSDQAIQREAERRLEEAERELRRAEEASYSARSARFTYASVNFSGLRSNFDDEKFALRNLRQSYDSKQFESVAQRAGSLSSSLEQIRQSFERAVAAAREEDERIMREQSSYYDSDDSSSSSSSGGSYDDRSSSGGSW